MQNRKNRRLKVYGQSNGYNYQDVPTIVLKGKWLKDSGFVIGSDIIIECENGKLTISVADRNFY